LLREGAANLVLDGDVFTADVDDIDKISVSETWIEGEQVY
jgi:predicted amidohydrolase YtcJ